MWFAHERATFRIEIAHPDLRRISCFRSPDQPFAVRREAGSFFMIRCWIQSPRVTAARRHDPQMRNLRVRFEIDIYAVENNPFAVGRGHRRADSLELHHILKRKGMLCRCLPKRAANACKKRDEKLESHIVLILRSRIAKARLFVW